MLSTVLVLGKCIAKRSDYCQLYFSVSHTVPCIYQLSTTDDDGVGNGDFRATVMLEDLANPFRIRCDSDLNSG